MPRVLFVNRFFYPDHSATSQLLSDLAFHLAEVGFDVEVLTSRQLYDDPSQVLPADDTIRGVRVHRIWTARFGRGRLLPRAVDYLTFYLSATAKLITLANANTIVVTETDPPLMSVPSALAVRLRQAKLVNWTQDLFPEIAQGLSVPCVDRLASVLRHLRNRSLACARINVVLGTSMAAKLKAEGIADEKIAVVHNWSLSESEANSDSEAIASLCKEWGLAGKFVVGYSGNFGRAHDFATALDAAALLKGRDDLRFLFIGDGAQRGWVEAQVAVLGLTNILFKPYQPLDRLAVSLALPDVHLVSLKAELEGLLVPSKLYAVLGAGRPVFFIGNTQGEIAQLLRQATCGQAFLAGDAAGLAAAIGEIADQPTKAVEMGACARALWSARFRRSQALGTWQALLTRLATCETK
jgi:colanic acid biosynthesis glycosyl transferase WcaI